MTYKHVLQLHVFRFTNMFYSYMSLDLQTCFTSTRHCIYKHVLQLLDSGFTKMDALDASAGMLSVAREKGIYKKYINAMLTGDQLDIPPGKNLSLNLIL